MYQLNGYHVRRNMFRRIRLTDKTPFKRTPRMRRLIALSWIFTPLLAIYIERPIEFFIKKRFLRRARKKLFSAKYAHLIRIGITGSYGKTTCKNILAKMLAQKYATVASPESFNTPMGFCRTVLEHLTPETEILIMEMGARRRGDIREMCKLFRPHHGILTSVGYAHLETFKTVENIRREKYELVRAVTRSGGHIVNGDTTPHYNVELCAELARSLGVDAEIRDGAVFCEGVPLDLPVTPHRLEIINAPNGVTILDDSYNSNPHGARLALKKMRETVQNAGRGEMGTRGLASVEDRTRPPHAVVMTCGMVELGRLQYELNANFGREIARVADDCIIVGSVNRAALIAGLHDGGFDNDKIFIADNVEGAKKYFPKLLTTGDVLLIENDLTENY